MKRCLRCEADEKPIYSRGLCHACYQYCRGMVLRGKVTWPQLIANGYATDRGTRGRTAATIEDMMSAPKAVQEEVESKLLFICQEKDCTFKTDTVEGYSQHRKETSHLVKMLKHPGVEVADTSLAESVIEMANLAIEGKEQP